jgi:ricin-type beta-trefoil lectin protein
MFVSLKIDSIFCDRPTETGLNDHDEVYFTVSGSSQYAPIQISRVSPLGSRDYYDLPAGKKVDNIELWVGNLRNGESVYLAVLIREQDNAQLGAIAKLAEAGARTLGAIFLDPSLGPEALLALKDGAVSLYQSFANDGDQTIGGFTVRIKNDYGNIVAIWDALPDTAIVSFPPHTGLSAEFDANGSAAHYIVRTSLVRPQLPMIVNRNSGKALDVVGGSLEDQAKVQQYTIHGGSNQRWFLKPTGIVAGVPYPHFAIIADHSGKCLDVPGGSKEDRVAIQQFTPHDGNNQRWVLILDGADAVFMNLNSDKVLDVAGGSLDDHATIQQFRYHGGLNQRWRLQY